MIYYNIKSIISTYKSNKKDEPAIYCTLTVVEKIAKQIIYKYASSSP